MQRSARVEEEVQRDRGDEDEHDQAEQKQPEPIERVPTERVLDDDAPFDGDEKQRGRRALPEVEEEDAEHLAEDRRGVQVGHHRAKQRGEETRGKAEEVEDGQGEKENERGRPAQRAAHQDEKDEGVEDDADDHDRVREQRQVVQRDVAKVVVPLAEQRFVVEKVDAVEFVQRLIAGETQRGVALGQGEPLRANAAAGVPVRMADVLKGDRRRVESEVGEERELPVECSQWCRRADGCTAGHGHGKEREQDEKAPESRRRPLVAQVPLGDVTSKVIRAEEKVSEPFETLNDAGSSSTRN